MTNLYPTASNIAVFLNGYHVEQGYQLQYEETGNKIPIYGYNDYKFSKIAQGRQMIQGVLVINFLFPGYLNTIIDTQYTEQGAYVPRLYNYGFAEKGTSQKQKLQDNIGSELRSELPPNDTAQDREARASYIASLLSKDKNTKEATKKALTSFFNAQDDEETVTTDLVSPLALENQDIILDIYYQDPQYATWFTRFKKVNFYKISQVASQAGAEGSSDPLYEVYSFIASERITKLVKEVT